jgi:hypothetical protein
MRALVRLADVGDDVKDDGVFGRELVREGVAGTGHIPAPVEEYIQRQLEKTPDRQSFRTTARGLRELYRLMDLIDDSGPTVTISDLGRRAAEFEDLPITPEQVAFWRRVIRNMTHTDNRGGTSHPYQVLLRLVARKPGITRAKCALALEARDDSPEELDRIVALADLPEDEIRARIGVSKSNWDNAKKVLPKFAEQLGDVVRTGQTFVLAVAPGRAPETAAGREPPEPARGVKAGIARPRAPRTSRAVTPETIGKAGTDDDFDEAEVVPPDFDPKAAAEALRILRDRLRRHNLLVREWATRFATIGARLYEDPFDALALIDALGFLAEIKTLDGSESDERDRVRDALAQLLYYEAFLATPVAGEMPIRKVAVFEGRISDAHRAWLNEHEIATVWKEGARFVGDELARQWLGGYLEEMR